MRVRNSLLAAMVLASWAQATVVITCQDVGNWVAEIGYDASSEARLVRAFALDITVDAGATIASIFDYKVGESTAGDPGYGIFPGSATPICDLADHPGLPFLPGLGTSGITVSMGSLYIGAENAPLVADSLFRLAVDPHGAQVVNINILPNHFLGTVLEDATLAAVSFAGQRLVPEPTMVVLFGIGSVALFRRRRGGKLMVES